MAMLHSDMTDLESLAKYFSRIAPRETGWALSRTLNNVAFRVKQNMFNEINDEMIVRNKGFVKRQLKYETTKGSMPIKDQVVRAGSQYTDRFSGWIEQARGGTNDSKRIFAGSGRTRGGKGMAKQSMRFKQGRDIPKNKEWIGPGRGNLSTAATIMGHQLKREGYINKPFIIEGSEHLNDGVYYMTPGGKLRWVAAVPNVAGGVKRLLWHKFALHRTLREKPLSKIFNRDLKRQLIKSYRRRTR